MSNITVPDAIVRLLRFNLLEERDLVEAIGLSGLEAMPDHPGWFSCRCMVPVRRQFDPETAELRRLDVTVRELDRGSWQVVSIAGLNEPET